jgi:hypothetical protein
MAIWECQLTCLEIISFDEHEWPVTKIENKTMQVEENNIIRLHRKLFEAAESRFPNCCDFVINKLDRVDKKTGKDYGDFSYRDISELSYKPTPSQKKAIEEMKNEILHKLVGDDDLKDFWKLLIGDYTSVKFLTDEFAWITSYGEILSHKEAKNIIDAIENFYSKLSFIELSILKINSSVLHHKDLEIIRNFNRRDYCQSDFDDLHVRKQTGKYDLPQDVDARLVSFLNSRPKVGTKAFERILDWLIRTDQVDSVIESLDRLNIESLQELNSLAGISGLRNVLKIWEDNKSNDNEEFWQVTLSENSFVLSQIFSFPVVLLEGKAYLGGKNIANKGGNLIDFLYSNNFTNNVALIEIKTPKTRILSSKYRDNVFSLSSELSGAVVQISNYKDTLGKEYSQLVNASSDIFEAFNPPCLIIAGNLQEELSDRQRRKSFELFRTRLSDIQVITYDELFKKIEMLVHLLEGNL